MINIELVNGEESSRHLSSVMRGVQTMKISKIDLQRLKQLQKQLSDIIDSIDEIASRTEYHTSSKLSNLTYKLVVVDKELGLFLDESK